MDKPVEGVPWPPEIVLTPSGWEAFCNLEFKYCNHSKRWESLDTIKI